MPTTSGYSINTGTVASPTVAELDTIFQPTTTAITHTVPNTSLTGYYVGAPTATDVSDMAFRYIFLTDVSNQEKYPKNTNYTVSRAGDFKDKDFKDIFQYGAYTSAITVANVASYDASNAAIDICGTYFYADVSGTSANAPTVSSFFTTKPYRYSLSGLSPNTTYSYIVRPRNGFNTVGTMKTFSVMTKPSITSFAVDTVCTDGATFNKIKFTFAGSFSKAYIYSNDTLIPVAINSTDTSVTCNVGFNVNISVCKLVPFNAAEDVSGTPMTLTLTDHSVQSLTTLYKDSYIYGGSYTVIGAGGSGGSGGKGGDPPTIFDPEPQGSGGGGGGSGQFSGPQSFYRAATKLTADQSVTSTNGAGGPQADAVGKGQNGNNGSDGGSSILYIGNSGGIKTVTSIGGKGGGGGDNGGGTGGSGGAGGNTASDGSHYNNGGGGAGDGAAGGGGAGKAVGGVTYGKGGGGSAGQKRNGNSQKSEAGGNGYCGWTIWYITVA